MKVFILYLSFSICVLGAESLKFGVFPSMSNSRMQKVFSPLKSKLDQALDIKVTIGTAKGFEAFSEELDNEKYDLAFIQPFDYPSLHERHAYIPIARRDTPLEAIVIVKKKGEYKNLNDLKKHNIAVISEQAAVTRIFRHSLKQKGMNVDKEFSFISAKNHFTCMQMVLVDKADACVTANRARNWFEMQKKIRPFETIFKSKAYPHTLFVIHPRVSEEKRNKIQAVLLKWDDRPAHIRSKNTEKPTFIIAKDTDYDQIRDVIKESK